MKVLAIIQVLCHLLLVASAATGVRGAHRILETSTRKITTFPEIKLIPENEVTPILGVEYASGIAILQLDYNALRISDRWRVCLQTDVQGFIPNVLGVYKGKIHEQGAAAVIDFSSMLRENDPFFDGCQRVSISLFNEIRENPDLFFVNAIMDSTPVELARRGIRGQVVQGLKTSVVPEELVYPFEEKEGASGVFSIYFENAGAIVCIDATFEGIDPALVHFHKGAAGETSKGLLNFSSKRLTSGRYHGCGTLASLRAADSDLHVLPKSTASEILNNPSGYYVHVHEGKFGTTNYLVGLRGQLDEV